jgi:hypothetical protein
LADGQAGLFDSCREEKNLGGRALLALKNGVRAKVIKPKSLGYCKNVLTHPDGKPRRPETTARFRSLAVRFC